MTHKQNHPQDPRSKSQSLHPPLALLLIIFVGCVLWAIALVVLFGAVRRFLRP